MSKKNDNFLGYYKKYKDKIYTYIWYRVNFDQSTAEDLTSEIFLKAFSHFDSYDTERPFQSWIYAIAKNHLLNHYRTANREVDLSQAGGHFHEELSKINVSLELQEAISKIHELDPYHKEVLLMRFVDGFDNKEIAQILDKDEGAVRTQMSRALNELRKKVKKHEQ